MTVITKKPVNPIAHLTPEDIEQIGIELDAIRQDVLDSRGAADAAYIRRIVDTQRRLELASRAVLLGSVFPPAWILGTVGLSIAKILENMEIGHNVMHGQWDWMRDPKIHSTTWEWDNASTAEGWKHSHNEVHHTYTNIVGKDNDLGYGIMRVDEDQRWHPMYLGQPLWNFINACFFEYGIAAYDLELGRNLRVPKEKRSEDFKRRASATLAKIRKQATKDYVVHPLLAAPFGAALPTLAANFTANLVRNVWSHSVIMCGHFPEGVETFEKKSIPANETRGEWYVRQMLGSANISGSISLKTWERTRSRAWLVRAESCITSKPIWTALRKFTSSASFGLAHEPRTEIADPRYPSSDSISPMPLLSISNPPIARAVMLL